MTDRLPRSAVAVQHAWALLSWLGSVLLFGVLGLVLVGREYREFMDCSNPALHQSANTWYGWTVALIATVVPVGIASGLAHRLSVRDRRRLMVLAVITAACSLVIWQWALDKDCDWYSAGTSPLQLV